MAVSPVSSEVTTMDDAIAQTQAALAQARITAEDGHGCGCAGEPGVGEPGNPGAMEPPVDAPPVASPIGCPDDPVVIDQPVMITQPYPGPTDPSLPPFMPEPTPPDVMPVPEPVDDSAEINSAARQSIRNDFVEVARDEKGGVGSDRAERQVDRMLFNLLPKIDFSAPGGANYAKEIGDFIRSMGHDISQGEVAHLRGLLNEAAQMLPADGAVGFEPGQPPVDEPPDDAVPMPMPDPTRPEPTGTRASPQGSHAPAPAAASSNDAAAKPAPSNDDDLMKLLLALLAQLLGADGDGKLDKTERADLLKQLAALTEKMAAEPAGGADAKEAKPAPAQPSSDADKSSAGETHKASTPAAGKADQAAPSDASAAVSDKKDNSDQIMLGLLRLLIDLMGANEDGKIDGTERNGLLKDLAGLMQKLLDDSAVAEGQAPSDATDATDGASSGSGSRAGIASADEPRAGNQMHDAKYFFKQTGLSTFLSGYNDSIVGMVNKALED